MDRASLSKAISEKIESSWSEKSKQKRLSKLRWWEFPAIHRHINNIVWGRPVDGGGKGLHMCRDKMNQVKAEGRTGACVYPALDTAKELCRRVMLLNEGRTGTTGDSQKIVNDYSALLQGRISI